MPRLSFKKIVTENHRPGDPFWPYRVQVISAYTGKHVLDSFGFLMDGLRPVPYLMDPCGGGLTPSGRAIHPDEADWRRFLHRMAKYEKEQAPYDDQPK